MSGPKYRKIALNGRPLPDEKPQNTEETDQIKEESYVDALNLNLRHSVTDIYVPLVGGQLALTIRRNSATQIWSNKTGLTPALRPDLPFGSCWTAAVAPIAEMVHQQPTASAPPCLVLDPDYVTVTDETGSSFRFLKVLVDGNVEFLTMPANQLDINAYTATLSGTDGGVVLTKKCGTQISYLGPIQTVVVPSDPTDPQYAYTESHSYYRAVLAEDRFGLTLTYEGAGLVPDRIVASTGQAITIETDGTKVDSVTDPAGNRTTYTYGPLGLTTVTRPDGVVTTYDYQSIDEYDPIPSTPPALPTIYYHIDLTSIESGGATYSFSLMLDQSKWVYVSQFGTYFYKAGEPMWVGSIELPDGARVSLALLSEMKLLYGGFEFEGARSTIVTDAAGFTRKYDFGDVSVIFLNNLEAQLNIAEHGNPLRPPKLVVFSNMVVTHVGYGTETFDFQLDAGMALSAVTDLCGNLTTFEYDDPLEAPSWAVGYPVTLADDVNVQARHFAGGEAVKQFSYETQWRVMTQIIDEDGRITAYALDSLGLRLSETIYPAYGATMVQQTLFAYGSEGYTAFMTQKTMLRLSDGAPTDASPPLVVNYVSDSAARVIQEIHETGTGDLVTVHTYDDNNNKLSTTDPNGNTTSFTYDGCNRLTLITYPPTGTPPVAATKALSYDARCNKVQEIDENGFYTLWQYDSLNRMIEHRRVMDGITPNDAVDLITTYTYNEVNSRTSITDPNGNLTTMNYDGLQRHIQTIRPITGDATRYIYDLALNTGTSAFDTSKFKPTSTIDPRGFVTQVTYDQLYRPVKKWAQYQLAGGGLSPLSAYSEMTYDLVGNLLQKSHWLDGVSPGAGGSTDPSRIEFVQKVYDALNRVIQITTSLQSTGSGVPPSTVTQYIAYTSTALKWQVTDELGRQHQTYYDGVGRALETISPLVDDGSGTMTNAITYTAYDGNNNVIQKTNPLGKIWQYQYDARNRKTVELEPGPTGAPPGPTIYHTYDPVGNAIALTDPNGNTTNTTYDQNNRHIAVEAPAVTAPDGTLQNPTTTTGYDKNGNVVSVIDPNLNETTNVYDEINRLTSTTDAASITVSYAYDLMDNRTSVTDGLLQMTNFVYDGHKRLTTTTDPAGKVTTLGYDAINKISRTDPLGQVTGYAYDLRNHLLTTTYTGRSADNRTYTYDLVGNLLSVVEPGHGGAADVAYTYDNLNRALTETSGGFTHQYKYDLANNRIYVQYGGTGRTLVSTYDPLNRLSTLAETGNTTTYTYDANGNVLSKELPNGEVIATTYDAINRRTAISAPGYTYTQLYDLVGNLVQIQESYPSNPALNRAVSNIYDVINRLKNETFSTLPLVLDGGTSVPPYYPAASTITLLTNYVYDAAHNRLQRVQGSVTTAYTYANTLNQLSQWSDGTNTVTYSYDFNGNRSTRTEAGVTDTNGYDYDNRLVSTSKSGTAYAYTYDYRTRRVNRVEGGTATQIVFSGGTSISEYDASSTLQVEYIRGSDWGGGVGGLLYSVRSSIPSFTHCNSRGDVTTKTDGTGAVTWQAEYEAFGTHPDEVGATLDRQKANTKEEDPTGLLNEGWRYRDLETGCFITADPAGMIDGPNRYTYVNQNPWTRFDPEGLAEDDPNKPKPKPNIFQRTAATVAHFFNGTLGQHGDDQQQTKPEATAKTAQSSSSDASHKEAKNEQASKADGQGAGPWQKNIYSGVFSTDNDPNNNGQKNAATGKLMGKNETGVALPDANAKGKSVELENPKNGKTVDTTVIDTGPHFVDNPYWQTNDRPKAEVRGNLYRDDPKANKQYKSDVNRAGIDSSPATLKALGIPVGIVHTRQGPQWETLGEDPKINWRFTK